MRISFVFRPNCTILVYHSAVGSMPGLGWCGPRTHVVASGQSCLDPLQFGPRINITYFGIRRADNRVVADSPVMPRDLQTA
jgi:hypothetical protein